MWLILFRDKPFTWFSNKMEVMLSCRNLVILPYRCDKRKLVNHSICGIEYFVQTGCILAHPYFSNTTTMETSPNTILDLMTPLYSSWVAHDTSI